MNGQELRAYIDGKRYTVALLFLRRAGYNFTCEFKRNNESYFAYSRDDDHIKMALEISNDDIVVRVLREMGL